MNWPAPSGASSILPTSHRGKPMSSNPEETPIQGQFVQYLCFKTDPEWRRLSHAKRAEGREAFARVVEEATPDIITHSYSTIGFKSDADLLLWRRGESPIAMQEMTARLLQTGI